MMTWVDDQKCKKTTKHKLRICLHEECVFVKHIIRILHNCCICIQYIYIQSNIQIQNDYIVQRSSDLTFLSNFPKNDRTIERSFVEKRLGTILTLPRLTSLPFIASTSHCLNFELLQPHITLSILTSHQLLPLHMNSTSHCLNFALP